MSGVRTQRALGRVKFLTAGLPASRQALRLGLGASHHSGNGRQVLIHRVGMPGERHDLLTRACGHVDSLRGRRSHYAARGGEELKGRAQDFEVHTLASDFFHGSGTMLAHVPHTACFRSVRLDVVATLPVVAICMALACCCAPSPHVTAAASSSNSHAAHCTTMRM